VELIVKLGKPAEFPSLVFLQPLPKLLLPKAARVRIGQPLMSIRVKPQHEAAVIAALKLASFKFAGRQVISKSTNWGFTPIPSDKYLTWKEEGKFRVDGVFSIPMNV